MDENDSDDYELLPHGQIEQLRKELQAAKKNPLREGSGTDLHDAMLKLDGSITKLIAILEDAQQDIIDEYQESKPIEKLNQILDQNETIARALISINDKLGGASQKEETNDTTNSASAPIDPSMNFNDSQFLPQPMPPTQLNPTMQNQQAMQPPQNQQPNQSSMQNQPAMQTPQNQPTNQLFSQQNFPPPSFQQPPVYQSPMQQSSNQQPQMMPVRIVQRQPANQQQPMQQIDDMMPPMQFQPQDLQFGNLPPLDSPPIAGAPNQDPNMLPEHKRKKFLGIM